MSLVENIITKDGIRQRDKVKVAIDRLKAFEPVEGYYLAFSGGKDSQCIYHLAVEAGVKFDAHYHITGIDPPELVYFIRKNYPDVKREMYKKSMYSLIGRKGLPSRIRRWCCAELKEHGGEGRICITGVRWAESVNRKNSRKPFEVMANKKSDSTLFNDNEEGRMMFENCRLKGQRVVNPIIDWEDEDVWEFIKSRNLEYCKLYDEGWGRIGCIGCPMAGGKREMQFQRYPMFYEYYKNAFEKYLPKYLENCKNKNKQPLFTTAEEAMIWWINDNGQTNDVFDSQIEMEGWGEEEE